MEDSKTPPQVEEEDNNTDTSIENNAETEEHMDVMHEVKDGDTVGEYVGQCKWFNNSYGYGFITIWDGPEKGTDIFVHHSGIKPLNSMYKTLKKGEYVMFDIYSGNKGKQAINVRGICNGPLLCDHIQIKKTPMPIPGVMGQLPPSSNPYQDSNAIPQSTPATAWNTVSYRKKLPPVFPGAKRRRNGAPAENAMDTDPPLQTPQQDAPLLDVEIPTSSAEIPTEIPIEST
jgi:CspA family cold shock protein